MDWNGVTFDWNRARAFLVTAEEGSLSAAARALGLAQPTLGRQIGALESELNVVLFERVGRSLVLTRSGHDLLDHVRAMGDAARRLTLAATGQSQSIEGTVAIAASDIYAAMLLPPVLARIRASYPGIVIRVVASDQAADLQRGQADIAIRNFSPQGDELIARKLRDVPARLYASPDYLDRLGPVVAPGDLARADFIGIDGTPGLMQALNTLGLGLSDANFPIRAGNMLAMWAMVTQGLGIGILDGYLGDAEPLVRRVLPGLKPMVFPIWLVSHREVHTSRRVRAVFTLLAEALGEPGAGRE